MAAHPLRLGNVEGRRPEPPTTTEPERTSKNWKAVWSTPLAVFACWRLAHGLVVTLFGGSFFSSAFQFDAGYYLEVAQYGYVLTDPTYQTFQTSAFFPSLPALSSPFIKVLGVGIGGTLVANGFALAAFITVWGVSRSWYGERIARHALITMALWPASMFLWMFYSEALLVTVTAGAFWADRRGRTSVAVVLVASAGLTRPVGMLFAPALVAARWWQQRRLDLAISWYLGAWVASIATLLVTMQVTVGDPLAFANAQRAWGRTRSAPWVPATEAVRYLVDELPRFPQETSMNLAAAVLFATLGIWGLLDAVHTKDREHLGPALWTLVAVAIPQFATMISGMVRYMVSGWTGLTLLARLVADRPVLRAAIWIGSAGVSLVLLHRHAVDLFVA